MIYTHRLALLATTTAAALSMPAWAGVERIEVIERTPFAAGMSFGDAGAYEKIRGVAYYALDPKLRNNAVIADLKHAPRDARGRVVFSSEFVLLRPTSVQPSSLICCAANLAVHGGVKSADGEAVLAVVFSAGFAAVRCTAG